LRVSGVAFKGSVAKTVTLTTGGWAFYTSPGTGSRPRSPLHPTKRYTGGGAGLPGVVVVVPPTVRVSQPVWTRPLQVRPFSIVTPVGAGVRHVDRVRPLVDGDRRGLTPTGARAACWPQPLWTLALQVAPSITLTVFSAVLATYTVPVTSLTAMPGRPRPRARGRAALRQPPVVVALQGAAVDDRDVARGLTGHVDRVGAAVDRDPARRLADVHGDRAAPAAADVGRVAGLPSITETVCAPMSVT